MVFRVGVLDLNSKKMLLKPFRKPTNHQKETQSPLLQGLPNQSGLMTDSSVSQI